MNRLTVLQLFIFWVLLKIYIYITSPKISQILRGSLFRVSSVVSRILKNYLQYLSNIPKYTTSVPYWMRNNLFLDIPFFMRNDINVIIKIFSTIDLSHNGLFTSVPLEGTPIFLLFAIGIMSLGSTKLEILSLKWLKMG